jgi:hypothetical protein
VCHVVGIERPLIVCQVDVGSPAKVTYVHSSSSVPLNVVRKFVELDLDSHDSLTGVL